MCYSALHNEAATEVSPQQEVCRDLDENSTEHRVCFPPLEQLIRRISHPPECRQQMEVREHAHVGGATWHSIKMQIIHFVQLRVESHENMSGSHVQHPLASVYIILLMQMLLKHSRQDKRQHAFCECPHFCLCDTHTPHRKTRAPVLCAQTLSQNRVLFHTWN